MSWSELSSNSTEGETAFYSILGFVIERPPVTKLIHSEWAEWLRDSLYDLKGIEQFFLLLLLLLLINLYSLPIPENQDITMAMLNLFRGAGRSFGRSEAPDPDGGPYPRLADMPDDELDYCRQVRPIDWDNGLNMCPPSL